MFNAAQEQFGGNPFAALVNNGSAAGAANPQAGQENRAPLPNPWGSLSSSTGAPGSGGGESPAAGLLGAVPVASAGPAGPAGSNPMSGMFNTPGMQSLMQQMLENPQLMQNMMNAPYTQNMLQSLGSNPAMAEQMILNNPLFAGKFFLLFLLFNMSKRAAEEVFMNIMQIGCLAGNTALRDQMRNMLPTFLNQLNNPEVQNLVSNPQALSAIMQIQQGMDQLSPPIEK